MPWSNAVHQFSWSVERSFWIPTHLQPWAGRQARNSAAGETWGKWLAQLPWSTPKTPITSGPAPSLSLAGTTVRKERGKNVLACVCGARRSDHGRAAVSHQLRMAIEHVFLIVAVERSQPLRMVKLQISPVGGAAHANAIHRKPLNLASLCSRWQAALADSILLRRITSSRLLDA